MASERLHRRLEMLLDEAEEAITQLNWVVVRDRAQAVIAIDPGNSEGQAFLATAERALAGTQSAPTDHPTNPPATASTDAPVTQPTSFANGRYEVKRFLGEGGKKRVYLAQDTLLDREVAFALIKTEGLDDVSRTRITREAQAMGRLGSHPHIVTVFDLGEHEGQTYMVTELMGGGDVEGVIEDATDHRLPLEQAIDIAKETCRGLEFAHSRGIVHRDLKPGNVWLTGDGVAKIGDFGLAVAIDRSRLTTEGMMVGTVSYMPPEQAMGGEVTPRADLYSLGAMLYEMVTGRPPFLGDDSVAIIGQHINTPPVAPTWHNSACSRPLEALILRLLAKDPSERPGSASDVLAALDGLDLTTTAETSVEEAQPLDSLAGGVFVGRQREMGELKAALEDALSGRGRLVTLVGEPGIGKTRTAQELATYAGLRSAQVLWGRCYEEQGMPPYWPWVQAIRSYVREHEPDQLRSEMGAGAADIAEVVSDVKERLPDLRPPPALDSPEQARFRLFDSITAFLKSASQKQPLVLVLDDLHWADQPSLLLLQFVARELGNSRLLLVGTYRDVDLNRQHPLAETLGELTRERLFQRVFLRGLTQQDVARFIEIAAGVDPPSGLVEAVHTQTEGNPLFVTEVVRLLVQEGELSSASGNRDSWTVRIPEGVREVIGRRLNRLSQRCNETLTIASVIGREFELRQLTPLVEDISEDRLLEVLEEALSARVIEELPQAVGRYQFTHALIQETLTEELTLTRRVRLHARIAETLEELYRDSAEVHAAELAHHFAEAEAVLGSGKLVHYSLLAGERALDNYAWEEGQTHFQQGLRAKGVLLESSDVAGDAEAAALLFGLGRTKITTTDVIRNTEALTTLRRAFDYYEKVGDVANALAVTEHPLPTYTLIERSDLDMMSRALALVQSDPAAASRILPRYGFTQYVLNGNYEGAREAFGSALAVARDRNDLILELRTLAFAATVDFFQLRWPQAREQGLRVVELSRQLDNPPGQIMEGRFYTATLLRYIGELEASRELAKHDLVQAERLGEPLWLGGWLWLHQELSWYAGNQSAAREYSDRGLGVSPSDIRLMASRAILEYEAGETIQGDIYLQRLIDQTTLAPPTTSLSRAVYGFVPLVIGTRSRITGQPHKDEVAHRISSGPLSSMPLGTFIARLGLAMLAVQNDDTAGARELYGHLETMQGTINVLSADRVLGLLSQTMRNMDQAVVHFENALSFCRKGYRPQLAWTCCDYADALRVRDGEGDRAKAITLLDESLAISSELGMRPLMERVLSRRDILKA